MRYGPMRGPALSQTVAGLRRTQVPGDVVEIFDALARGEPTWCSLHSSRQSILLPSTCAGIVGLPGSAIDHLFDHPFQQTSSRYEAAPNLQSQFEFRSQTGVSGMADAILNVGEQTEVSLLAPDRGAVRRPWHPSQGGAPWDRDCTDDWHTDECDCPACRRAAPR